MLLPTVSSLQLCALKETTSVTTCTGKLTKEAANDPARQAIYIHTNFSWSKHFRKKSCDASYEFQKIHSFFKFFCEIISKDVTHSQEFYSVYEF